MKTVIEMEFDIFLCVKVLKTLKKVNTYKYISIIDFTLNCVSCFACTLNAKHSMLFLEKPFIDSDSKPRST